MLSAAGLAALIALPAAWGASASAAGAGGSADARTAAASCPWVASTAPIDQRVAQLMSHMTLGNKITMVEGHGTTNPYVFYTPAIPSLCIPAVGLEDGPAGVADGLTGVTQLPAGVSLAATWDPSLAGQYGSVIGAEEFGKGASANLGPTVNIDRDPRWGRSFEALSEDPYLNSALDVPEIDGIQSQNVEDQVKHYDAYNQETYRNTPADNVIITNRALHEIYMPSFYNAVTSAQAASVMCAYSYVNGNASCNNSYLETSVLRDEWNFPGFVMSDYGALHSTQGAVQGTDQEQPFDTYYGTALQTAVSNGTIPVSALNTMVYRVLTEMFRFNLFSEPRTGAPGDTVTTPAHQALADQVAEAGTTLLQNNGGTLPLSGKASVAVIGPAASASPVYGGGGSAYVIPSSTVTPLDGIKALDAGATYTQGLPTDTSLAAIPAADLSPAYPAAGTPFGGSYTGTLTAPQTGTYVLAITNPCGCYTSTYLRVDGKDLIDNPSTPPVHTYSAAIEPDRGHQVHAVDQRRVVAAAVGDSGRPGARYRRRGRRGEGGVHGGRGRLRRHRVRGHRPAEPEPAVRPGRADLGCGRGESAHGGGDQRGRAGRDAVAGQRRGRGRRLVPRADQRHGTGQRAVREHQPGRPPAGDVPGVAAHRCPPPARPSSRATARRCCTPRASTSVTAGTTRRVRHRCSPSGTACPTPRSRSAACGSAVPR